jgi:hypothetical protein
VGLLITRFNGPLGSHGRRGLDTPRRISLSAGLRLSRKVLVLSGRRILVSIIVSLLLITGLPGGLGAKEAQSRNVRVIAHVRYGDGADIDFSGNRVFFTQIGSSVGSVRVMDISQNRPRVVGNFTCGGYQNDVAVVSSDVIALGSHFGYCMAQPSSGVNLLDVSDPSNPRQLGFAPIPYGSHTLTKHPTEPLIYTSSAIYELRTWAIDVSNPSLPVAMPLDVPACHDISFHFSKRGKLAFCAAAFVDTEIWDVSDPLEPKVLGTIEDSGIGYHHLAVATPDGKYLAIGDESPGRTCSGEKREREPGAVTIYDISDPTEPKMAGFLNAPRGPQVCWAHNFNFVAGTRQLVIGWWQGGTSVHDLSDPRHPKEIAYFNPDGRPVWSAYSYKGRIYVNSGSGAWVLEVRGLESGS